MIYDTATPYIASYVILRQNGKIAFVLRENTAWMNGHYSLPAGKVENGETYLQTAVREVKEEAGADVKINDLRPVLTIHRKEPEMTWVDVYFEAVKWKGEPYNAEPHVHGELVWLNPKKLPKNMVPDVKYAIGQIEAGKTYGQYGWEK